ncbi:MAG: twin-arginine translocase TatA/TatE family subunit [Acidobacteriota bacterium]
MGSLGMPEIITILVIALIIFGPRKLPELGKTLGKSLAQFRKASEDFKRQWEDEVEIERHRIEAPRPEAVEHAGYSEPASTDVQEIQTSEGEEPNTSAPEEPSLVPTAAEMPVTAHHEEAAAKETKHDWM